MSKVIVRLDEMCSSKMRDEVIRGLPGVPANGSCSYAFPDGTILRCPSREVEALRPKLRLSWLAPDSETAFELTAKDPCDKASPDLAVMLHLRSRYVSKAAILTIPVSFVPVENRSPA
jgi:hypothetical protein